MRMLAEGYQVGAVARSLGVDRRTIRDWRDSPEGQRLLDAARKAREAQLVEGRDAALRILRDAAPRAAQRLVDALAAPASASTAAAEAILARVGLPRSSKLEATVEPGVDLSKLSDDEIATLEALHAKARG
jgi:transposase